MRPISEAEVRSQAISLVWDPRSKTASSQSFQGRLNQKNGRSLGTHAPDRARARSALTDVFSKSIQVPCPRSLSRTPQSPRLLAVAAESAKMPLQEATPKRILIYLDISATVLMAGGLLVGVFNLALYGRRMSTGPLP